MQGSPAHLSNAMITLLLNGVLSERLRHKREGGSQEAETQRGRHGWDRQQTHSTLCSDLTLLLLLRSSLPYQTYWYMGSWQRILWRLFLPHLYLKILLQWMILAANIILPFAALEAYTSHTSTYQNSSCLNTSAHAIVVFVNSDTNCRKHAL